MDVHCQSRLRQCLEKKLAAAAQKLANHFTKEVHAKLTYALVYSDGSEVNLLPGTTKHFILKDCREDVGRNYNRLTFYITKRNDFVMAELPELLAEEEGIVESEHESDSDDLLLEKPIFADATRTPLSNSRKQPFFVQRPFSHKIPYKASIKTRLGSLEKIWKKKWDGGGGESCQIFTTATEIALAPISGPLPNKK